jgi:hypothetical protein
MAWIKRMVEILKIMTMAVLFGPGHQLHEPRR